MKGSRAIIWGKLSWRTVYRVIKGQRRESIERDRSVPFVGHHCGTGRVPARSKGEEARSGRIKIALEQGCGGSERRGPGESEKGLDKKTEI